MFVQGVCAHDGSSAVATLWFHSKRCYGTASPTCDKVLCVEHSEELLYCCMCMRTMQEVSGLFHAQTKVLSRSCWYLGAHDPCTKQEGKQQLVLLKQAAADIAVEGVCEVLLNVG